MTGRHRARVRPRWGRIGASVAAAAVTVLALVGAFGGVGARDATAAVDPVADTNPLASPTPAPSSTAPATTAPASTAPATTAPATTAPSAPDPVTSVPALQPSDTALPADSGTGRRAVFSQSRQRVWIVDADGTIERTYLVSGSLTDNLEPGTYKVYSRSRWAVGVDDSGVMQYFVRFTKGPEGAAIGFHSIPTKNGVPVQQLSELGTPESHGCIRQKEADAVAMWDFARLGTTVVVTA